MLYVPTSACSNCTVLLPKTNVICIILASHIKGRMCTGGEGGIKQALREYFDPKRNEIALGFM
jgi:hypothetical protein